MIISVNETNYHPKRTEEGKYQLGPELGLGFTIQIDDCLNHRVNLNIVNRQALKNR